MQHDGSLRASGSGAASRGRSPTLLNTARLQAAMKAEGVDAVVATSAENVTYTSGYWALSQWIRRGPQIYVVLPAADLASSEIIASTTLLDQIADQDDVWVTSIRRYGYFPVDRSNVPLDALDSRQVELYALPDHGDSIQALVTAIQAAGLLRSRIAIDEMGLLPGHWERLRDKLPDAKLVAGFQLLRRVRAVKTVEEIARLRRVAEMRGALCFRRLPVARWLRNRGGRDGTVRRQRGSADGRRQ
jgi:Xaa-Pro dipeptidase